MNKPEKWLHSHPYAPFLPEAATHLIVGTLPPPRFSFGGLKKGDVSFCYGSIDGQLWPILNRIYNLNLEFANTPKAIQQRKDFLAAYKIGVCDIVSHCYRVKLDASDLGMQAVELRDMFYYLNQVPSVKKILFTGGDSKNGPAYFFKRYLKSKNIAWKVEQKETPKKHSFIYKNRCIETVSLIAPSGAANRAVGSLADYKRQKQIDKDFTTIDYRVLQYEKEFPAFI